MCALTRVRSAAARRCRPPTDPAARPPRRPALSAGVARGTGRRAGRGRGRRRAGGPTAGRDEGVQGVRGVRRGPHTPPITPALPLSSLPTPRLGGRHPRALPDGRRGPVVRRASSAALCLVLAVRGAAARREGTCTLSPGAAGAIAGCGAGGACTCSTPCVWSRARASPPAMLRLSATVREAALVARGVGCGHGRRPAPRRAARPPTPPPRPSPTPSAPPRCAARRPALVSGRTRPSSEVAAARNARGVAPAARPPMRALPSPSPQAPACPRVGPRSW